VRWLCSNRPAAVEYRLTAVTIGAFLPFGRPQTDVPFVTTLTLESGDRAVLERVVGDVKRRAERKGVELKGPHAETPVERSVPQARRCDPDGPRFSPWRYTVYVRRLEVVGHDEFARSVAEEPFPEGIHLDVEVDRVSTPDGR